MTTPTSADGAAAAPAGLLDRVRATAAEVAAHAHVVRIDTSRIPRYAVEVARIARHDPPGLDPACHHLGHGPGTVAFILALDAVNFGSGWFPLLKKAPNRSGYETIAAALTAHCQVHGPPDASWLAEATAEGCATLFGQDPGDPDLMALMGLFAQAWRDLGRFLKARFGGDPLALVAAAEGRAEGLVALLAEMPLFQDVHDHTGTDGVTRRVPLLKRAQIMANDLALAAGPEDAWGRFSDLEALTLFADNLVPHVLRVDGILLLDEGLTNRLDQGTLLTSGETAEVELRACAVHAVELMSAALRVASTLAAGAADLSPEVAQRWAVPPRILDMVLWNRGRGAAYKARPRPRCRCPYY